MRVSKIEIVDIAETQGLFSVQRADRTYIQVALSNQSFSAWSDSGSKTRLMSQQVYDYLGKPGETYEANINVQVANKQRANAVVAVNLDIRLGEFL